MKNRLANHNQPLNQNEYHPLLFQNQSIYEPGVQINQAHNQNMRQPVYPIQPVNSACNEIKLLNQPVFDEIAMGKINNDKDEFMSDIRRGFVIKVYGILTATLFFHCTTLNWTYNRLFCCKVPDR